MNVVHQQPPRGSIILPCCGISTLSQRLDALDYLTDDPERVTCQAPAPKEKRLS